MNVSHQLIIEAKYGQKWEHIMAEEKKHKQKN
jgi:hypothetical protein